MLNFIDCAYSVKVNKFNPDVSILENFMLIGVLNSC